MIEFKSSDMLVQFLEDNLPKKIQDELFYSTYKFEHKGKEREGRTRLRPPMVFRELLELGFAFGYSDDPEHYFFPKRLILNWTKLKQFIEVSDSLKDDQSKYALISINEACKFMEVTRPTLYKIIRDGKIPTVQILSQKRIQLKDLLEYIERNKK